MPTFIVRKLNEVNAEPIEVEAESATITADSKVVFHDADSNVVAQFVNVDFYPKPAQP